MAVYKIYMRSFAPWRQFGTFTRERSIPIPVVEYRTPGIFDPGVSIRTAPLPYAGSFHGDGRGFSLDTTSPRVTARVHAILEVVLPTGVAGRSRAWCDASFGPSMGVGFHGTATASPSSTFTVSKTGSTVNAVIEYGAANPLVTPSPDIDAKGEFAFTEGTGGLTVNAIVSGDQFPACEGFVEDPQGNKVFLGGFAPPNKDEITRLFGRLNKPQEVWFESELVIQTNERGHFLNVTGGGSGSNTTGPACENLRMSITEWNARIMGSIPMPSDAP